MLGESKIPGDSLDVDGAANANELAKSAVIVGGIVEQRRASTGNPSAQQDGAPAVEAGVAAAPVGRVGAERQHDRHPGADSVERLHPGLAIGHRDVDVQPVDLVIGHYRSHLCLDPVVALPRRQHRVGGGLERETDTRRDQAALGSRSGYPLPELGQFAMRLIELGEDAGGVLDL